MFKKNPSNSFNGKLIEKTPTCFFTCQHFKLAKQTSYLEDKVLWGKNSSKSLINYVKPLNTLLYVRTWKSASQNVTNIQKNRPFDGKKGLIIYNPLLHSCFCNPKNISENCLFLIKFWGFFLIFILSLKLFF